MDKKYTLAISRMKQHQWDLYFLRTAKEVSKKSKCLSRKIGAVLVKDKCIISTGWNGAPRGVKECNERSILFYNKLDNDSHFWASIFNPKQCPRREFGYKSGQGLHLCQAGHAERNALINAGRNGISTKDTTLYCVCPLPCKECCIEIINAGVIRVVCLEGNDYDGYSRVLLNEAKVKIKQIKENEL